MKHCVDYEERLNDHLDGLLAPPEKAGVERHLEGCAGCREFLAAMRSLRERAASLPRGVEPARDLWPEIRKSLPASPRGALRPLPGFPAWAAGWGRLGLSAAAAAVVLLVAVAVVIGLRRDAVPPGPDDGGLPGVAPAVLQRQGSLALAEAEYRAATEKLLATLQRERPGASPEAVRVIEENLQIVDRAIQEIHRAAVDRPGSAADERITIGLYRTRFELLRQAVRLSSREGEEKQS